MARFIVARGGYHCDDGHVVAQENEAQLLHMEDRGGKLTVDRQSPEAQVGDDRDGSEEEEDVRLRASLKRKARKKQERNSGHKHVNGGRARK